MGLVFNFQPHATQRIVAGDRHIRFRTICCGRRWGKTLLAAAELFDIAGICGGTYAWIAPSYWICERGIKALKAIGGEFVRFSGQNPVRATFTGGGGLVEIYFLTADHPETILGDGYDGVIVDEAARMEKTVWEQYIRPALADKSGWGIIISTPKGRNWFYDFFTRGQDPNETQYKSYRFSSRDNPTFHQSEWEETKRTTPEDIFRQEYEGAFLEDSAGVFHGVDDCTYEGESERRGETVIGCDLAKHTDFTVLIEMDRKTGECFRMDRFNQLEWPIQKERIVNFWQPSGGLLVPDGTGVGDAIVDDLKLVISNIAPLKFTNATKTQLIQRLIVAIEQRQISWPKSWTVLTNELKRYEYDRTPSGNITYNAPAGFNDDCVIALALANSESEVFKRQAEDLQAKFDALAPGADGGGEIEERLLSTVNELTRQQKENALLLEVTPRCE